MTAMSASRRDTLSRAAILVGGVVLFVAGLVLNTARGFLDPGHFAGRLAASLGDDDVAAYVADRLTDAVVEENPDLIPVRPLILATMTGIVRADSFRGVVRMAARSTHRALFDQAGRGVVLSLPDVGVLLRGALEQASPSLAAKVPRRLETALASTETEQRLAVFIGFWGLGERVRRAALGARVRRCERERGHLPNIIAVDFSTTGDLFRVVRTLNGLDSRDAGRRKPS